MLIRSLSGEWAWTSFNCIIKFSMLEMWLLSNFRWDLRLLRKCHCSHERIRDHHTRNSNVCASNFSSKLQQQKLTEKKIHTQNYFLRDRVTRETLTFDDLSLSPHRKEAITHIWGKCSARRKKKNIHLKKSKWPSHQKKATQQFILRSIMKNESMHMGDRPKLSSFSSMYVTVSALTQNWFSNT